MIHCEPEKGNDQVTVTFILGEDGIDGQVAVVGDFNGCDPHGHPVAQARRLA